MHRKTQNMKPAPVRERQRTFAHIKERVAEAGGVTQMIIAVDQNRALLVVCAFNDGKDAVTVPYNPFFPSTPDSFANIDRAMKNLHHPKATRT